MKGRPFCAFWLSSPGYILPGWFRWLSLLGHLVPLGKFAPSGSPQVLSFSALAERRWFRYVVLNVAQFSIPVHLAGLPSVAGQGPVSSGVSRVLRPGFFGTKGTLTRSSCSCLRGGFCFGAQDLGFSFSSLFIRGYFLGSCRPAGQGIRSLPGWALLLSVGRFPAVVGTTFCRSLRPGGTSGFRSFVLRL